MTGEDIKITRGSNVPVAFRFPVDFDPSGYTFNLRLVRDRGAALANYTLGSGLTLSGRDVIWAVDPAMTQTMPLGRLTRYDLQYTSPDNLQRSLTGYVDLAWGSNPD
jgi:hypothetical protein